MVEIVCFGINSKFNSEFGYGHRWDSCLMHPRTHPEWHKSDNQEENRSLNDVNVALALGLLINRIVLFGQFTFDSGA
jgi:hypothetical protein